MDARAVVASAGVAMYLTRDAIYEMLREAAACATGSTIVMSFMLPIDLISPDERMGIEAAARGARANGTPFVSFFAPDEIVALARVAGFERVEHVPARALAERYFGARPDGLLPSSGEELIVATT